MNAVIYARFSSTAQQEQSIDGQVRHCTEFAEKNGYKIINTYIDKALSGRNDNRPAFQQMISDSSKGTFQYVLVWKFDRFSRDRFDSAIYKSKLRKNGVRVISITENVGDGIDGNLIEAIYEAMAENYSRQLSQNVVRGMRESALQCKSVGGSVPFGYKIEDKRYVIDEEAAKIVRYIFEAYASGKRKCEIAEELNSKGFRNSKGEPFKMQSLSKMFTNRKYIGVYKYGDIVIENGFPAIISKELFEKCADRAVKNKHTSGHANARVTYHLAGKAYCGHCGAPLTGDAGTGRSNMYYYYSCSGKKRHLEGSSKCPKKRESKDILEAYVAEQAIKYFTDREKIFEIAEKVVKAFDRSKDEKEKISEVEKEIRTIDTEINNLVNSLLNITAPALIRKVNERSEQLEKQRAELSEKLVMLKLNSKVSSITADEFAEWILTFCDGDLDDKSFVAKILDKLVHKVFIYDDKLLIYYNIKDSEEVTYSKMLLDISGSTIDASGRPKNAAPLFSETASFVIYKL
ncbi:MAG: recombinase family protein [Ruminococcaceae bacterium]|nr:recombinase family protein [Oscillospiraceae bacterium]